MKKSPIALVITALGSMVVQAAPGDQGASDFGAAVSVSSAQTDNALKTPDNKLSEQQQQFSASVFGAYNNDLIDLSSNYSVSQMHYQKDSQDGRTNTIGQTELVLGKPHHLFDLTLSHSIHKLPRAAGQLDLEANTDEKQVLSIQPGFHTRLTGTDTLFINANATEVDYRFDEQKNSSREGATLGLIHAFSMVDSVSLYVSQTDIEFDFSRAVNYSQTTAVLAYETRLRQLNYRIELGQSRTDSSLQGKSDDPYYALTVNYQTGLHQWALALNQQQTDSSRGFDASAGFGSGSGGGLGGSDVTAEQLDQVLLRHAELSWTTRALCQRCSLSLSLYGDQHDYQTLAREEQRLGGSLGLNYQLSRSASVGLDLSREEQDLTGSLANTEYQLDNATLFYNYSFVNGLSLRAFTTQQERSSAAGSTDYKELRAGLVLGYRF